MHYRVLFFNENSSRKINFNLLEEEKLYAIIQRSARGKCVMVNIKATIFFEKRYWVGSFERTDEEGYAVARHIFGAEPTDPEVYDFVLNHYLELNFGVPQEFTLQIKRMNPKRVQKEIRKEMEKFKETARPSTFAQDYMREELEKKKLEKKRVSSKEKALRKEEQFSLKQQKKKRKHRGR